MRRWNLSHYAISSCVTARCSQDAADRSRRSARRARCRKAVRSHGDPSGSWMLPEAQSENLVYVSLLGNGGVGIFSYVGKQVGRLKGPGFGFNGNERDLCADNAGNVFVIDPPISGIVEYAHAGKKPIKILSDKRGVPTACSLDPATGNLAVVNSGSASSIAIFNKATGKTRVILLAGVTHARSCSYDDKSNLFITGDRLLRGGWQFYYAELPAGADKVERIHLEIARPNLNGGVGWDGKAITISNGVHRLYRTVGAEIVGRTHVVGGYLNFFLILDTTLIGVSASLNGWDFGSTRVAET